MGNITHQVNTSNVAVAEYNFDAWGRRRSADDWSYTLDGNDLALFADRGFTAHETLPWFNLVNMNGRLYDPLVGRFLSADPYVQDGGLTQSYNRYSYCLNNPLRYTDYSGYTWGIFKPFVKAAKWIGNNIGGIATGAYLVGAGVVTIFCPVAGMAMFGAYLGGMSANDGKINMGSWDWKDPTTYVGIGLGGAMGALGGQLLFGANGVLAGGTSLNVSLSATLQNAGAVFANINISATGISLADVGYATIAGGGAILTGTALHNLLFEENPVFPRPHYTERGRPMTPKIEVQSNKNYFNITPGTPDWLQWIMWPLGGWTIGRKIYENWATPDISAPTTTDKTPQVGPKR
ncbi:MAG: RHS repeat-associated core domain-containing protein [Ignavibacteria bacterium]|nr:RHS repeat-associated core domain-containing protein [Ignavibacteria bacterium]